MRAAFWREGGLKAVGAVNQLDDDDDGDCNRGVLHKPNPNQWFHQKRNLFLILVLDDHDECNRSKNKKKEEEEEKAQSPSEDGWTQASPLLDL
ncbi:hypothetical protein CMV_018977 [Castanea mollissima]|uniref:Uncharacterized protein n=1 Tax=Castanea mollissima TaxID=60419 RepID=A0A8J4R2H0_9ROSI|nr:hypothetical protein CMV_018977 [Castanea mollissima]